MHFKKLIFKQMRAKQPCLAAILKCRADRQNTREGGCSAVLKNEMTGLQQSQSPQAQAGKIRGVLTGAIYVRCPIKLSDDVKKA